MSAEMSLKDFVEKAVSDIAEGAKAGCVKESGINSVVVRRVAEPVEASLRGQRYIGEFPYISAIFKRPFTISIQKTLLYEIIA